MILVGNDDILRQTSVFSTVYKSASNAPLLYDRFVEKTHQTFSEIYKKKYPYYVKIPKSLNKMFDGDLEPEYIIKVESPFYRYDLNQATGEQIKVPIWYGDSTKGVFLRFGYRNGDSRYCSNIELGDNSVHAFIGGATGQGKSVALNNLILNMADEYAPWELQLIMSDAKIVEFKTYALHARLPQIRSIAAASDADYAISLFESILTEMNTVNEIFSHVGVKSIDDFRKSTGLAFPRKVIIMDEVQSAFKYAGKRSGDLVTCIDKIARLGRNTGYHLIMASQEVSSDIPKDTMSNIKIRGALGCNGSVSERILGNDEAKLYYGSPGNIIVNTSPETESKAGNVLFKTPFIKTNRLIEIANDLTKVAAESGFRTRPIDFYDEGKRLYEKDFKSFISGFPCREDTMYLGEPSYVVAGNEKVTKLIMDGKEVENILIMGYSVRTQLRYFIMLKDNVLLHKDRIINNVLCTKEEFLTDGVASELSNNVFTDNSYENSNFFKIVKNGIYRRKFLIDVDMHVFKSPKTSEYTDGIFCRVCDDADSIDSTIMRSRVFYAYSLLMQTSTYNSTLMAGKNKDEDTAVKEIRYMIQLYRMYKTVSRKIESSDMPPVYNWVLGYDKVKGLGRDPKIKFQNEFKGMLDDGYSVNIRFVITTSSLLEVTTIKSSIRWYLTEDLLSSDQSKINCDDYPAQCAGHLGILFSPKEESKVKTYKFKKMVFDGEVI